MAKNIIGILGGMGPAATADMFQKFIRLTPANCDQEHIPLLISSIPDIPDRTRCILAQGEDPAPLMEKYVQGLENAGATCIIIACNTAHYWFEHLQAKSHVEMLSMIDTTLDEVLKSRKQKIGLLATDATLASGLYKNRIEAQGLTFIRPNEAGQKEVMESIYLLKSGEIEESTRLMLKQKDELIRLGAEIIILGCTEVPIILAKEIERQPQLYVDSTLSLVQSAINWYQTH
ncbi:aspartate racemase [Bibersteinia trehalosi USDA-ARS-USMARC-188]|uniref:Aspartate racemase n=4 Tax=Bibersteinia trehalosi TaxID=47735 RepID=A0A4V7ICL0_BIBTR|nr:amino acid racemase [Bibersteinia trehalosi]AGH37519.1 aspartate racemase [Bibersteinia trehalosi USDA-ARS-USMARC-192]AHG82672.1 aspartate racemase [Bibersteinia trehalosi USDA-ARS-USMARC-188]AHG85008.1 aspartate racemase [Bibersteinia trehalosi USDA-ARS-USMARC-189]OAQ13815.1 aspartate racemase [Bibersteinia trehalosi Y31]RRN05956.1 aspartate/glutamate racemase family protein [Bibersteinia trehalosi]